MKRMQTYSSSNIYLVLKNQTQRSRTLGINIDVYIATKLIKTEDSQFKDSGNLH